MNKINPEQKVLPGFIRLSNGKVRARPGMGKRPWGLAPGAFNKPRDEDADLRWAVGKLHIYFVSLARNYADLAKGGCKDEARRWAMNFQMSGIHRIFSDSRYGVPFEQIRELNDAVSRVTWAAYPDEIPNFTTDIRAVRYYLERISQALIPAKKPRQSYFRLFPVQNFSPVVTAKNGAFKGRNVRCKAKTVRRVKLSIGETN